MSDEDVTWTVAHEYAEGDEVQMEVPEKRTWLDRLLRRPVKPPRLVTYTVLSVTPADDETVEARWVVR